LLAELLVLELMAALAINGLLHFLIAAGLAEEVSMLERLAVAERAVMDVAAEVAELELLEVEAALGVMV
jgi:hypothetical protein